MESEHQSWYDFTSNKSSTEKQRALWIIVYELMVKHCYIQIFWSQTALIIIKVEVHKLIAK